MTKTEFENKFINKIICNDWIKGMNGLPNKIFHCVITSSPYWSQRDYKTPGQLGLEKTPEEHIEKLVEGFREVRRILRDDGVLWINYGDKYSGSGMGAGGNYELSAKQNTNPGANFAKGQKLDYNYNLEPGDLLMLPARVALALQADGWILRDDIIWAKAISFCDKYSGSCMPESINGWRWERHRIKIKAGWNKECPHPSKRQSGEYDRCNPGGVFLDQAQWQDCPGCEKCEPNGGLVLRKGFWRCTKAHEHVFQFVKTNDYFCDMEAVREEMRHESAGRYDYAFGGAKNEYVKSNDNQTYLVGQREQTSGRNLRNVWAINPRGYKEAHYATFPEALIEPMIKVSTSQKGVCPKCGSQWARIVDKKASTMNIRVRDVIKGRIKNTDRKASKHETENYGKELSGESTTLGWKPTCDCYKGFAPSERDKTVPALVADIFAGSGTTLVVAAKLGRNYFGIEINPEYVKDHCDIRVKAAETGLDIKEIQDGQQALFD